LILFTRYPVPGKVKTRLIPVLGPEGSCKLHRLITEKTLQQLKEYASFPSIGLEVRFDGGNKTLMKDWLGSDLNFRSQGQGDLGVRLERAFREAFQSEINRVVIVGSDCPGLTAEILRKAFDGLTDHDLVLGPARDGGYYLVGLSRQLSPLFADIPWGTEKVFSKTCEIANKLGLKQTILEPLDDIDRPEDLPVWEKIQGNSLETSKSPCLSVIIPTFNEAAYLSATLARIPRTPRIEIVIVDGSSQDTTLETAVSSGARIIISPRGRSRQMNAGAREAKGEFFLFLHADTLLPDGFADYIPPILSRPGVSAGAFQLKFHPPLPGLNLIETLANWRARTLQWPYGDQAIFLRADRFQALGGFAEMALMEDVDLIRRLRRQGRIAIVPVPVVTSSRRWQNYGVWRTSLMNQLILAGYFAGIPINLLARWYGKKGKKVDHP
jgi:rSAM/selenodomain-associated transferase 2/rSAM/selenodomain-associated transferase 1